MVGEQLSALRAHPAVIVSVVAAAVAVALFALVGTAYMLGWIPSKGDAAKPAASAAAAKPASSPAPGLALLPGETLVVAPEPPPASVPRAAPPLPAAKAPGPVTPSYSQPAPATPSFAPGAKKAAAPPSAPTLLPPSAQPPMPTIAKTLPSRAAPSAPTYRREDPTEAPPRSYERSFRTVCVNCGTVSSIRAFGDDWEVRVRFEDGTSETIRYPERPRLRLGERVTLEEGRLVPE